MLNKLLKRCMPWMDKGRWYHVRINDDGSTIMDEIFDNVEIPDDDNTPVRIYFKPGMDYVILDTKVTLSKTPPGAMLDFDPVIINGTSPVSGIQLQTDAACAIVLPMVLGSDVEYWFFMKPLLR